MIAGNQSTSSASAGSTTTTNNGVTTASSTTYKYNGDDSITKTYKGQSRTFDLYEDPDNYKRVFNEMLSVTVGDLTSSKLSEAVSANMPGARVTWNGAAKPITITDQESGGVLTELTYHPDTGIYASEHYEVICKPENGNIVVIKELSMADVLYKDNDGKMTCGFDGYSSTTPGKHEGIDFQSGYGNDVYSLTDGVVTNVIEGKTGTSDKDEGSLSLITVYYDENLNDSISGYTVIYLHLDPDDIQVGDAIKKGDLLGYEDRRGVTAIHTHVEVREGKQTKAAPSRSDNILSNKNPAPFWLDMGYSSYSKEKTIK